MLACFKIYFPSEKSVYGTTNAYLTLDDKFNATHGGVIYYGLEVDRINWKSLDQAPRRCRVDSSERGATRCITEFVERGGTLTDISAGNGRDLLWAHAQMTSAERVEGGSSKF